MEHLYNMVLTEEKLLCRLCNEEGETTPHIIFKCEALCNWRFQTIGFTSPRDEFPKKNLIVQILELT